MKGLSRLRALWRRLSHPGRADRALDDELRSYVELLAAEHERAGLSPAEARRSALASVGGVAQVREATRETWTGHTLRRLLRESRYAIRSLRRSPAFAATAILTPAIGIGGAAAIYTVVTGSLLRPLVAVPDADRLVTVERVQSGVEIAEFSYPDYLDLRDRATTLAGLAAFNGTSMTLTGPFDRSRVWVSYVTSNFFDVLSTPAALGAVFHGRAEGATAARDVTVIGHDLWQERFRGSADAVGSVIQLNGHAFTVIGVAPPGFIGAMKPYPMDLWIPIAAGAPPFQGDAADLATRQSGLFRVVGRLAPGRTVSDAQRDLSTTAQWLAATYPSDRARGVRVVAGAGMAVDELDSFSRVPALLAMTVGMLLLIACGNVASLMIVRGAGRRRELATCIALGAPRSALVRQVAFESAAIGLTAGAVGLAFARALLDLPRIVNTVVPLPNPDLTVNVPVLVLAAAVSLVTAVLVSIVPALQVLRVPASEILKDFGGSTGGRRRRGHRALVAAQVGASFVLLAGAAMISSAFHRVLAAEDAVDPQGLSDGFVEIGSIHDRAQQMAYYRALLDRAAADPARLTAALTSTIPPFTWADHATVFRRGEEPPPSALVGHELDLGYRVLAVVISEDFFRLMRMPLLEGRAFTRKDDGASTPVVILSQRLADALWPGQDPIGRIVAWPASTGTPRPPLEVVGVARDTRDISNAVPPLAMYVPFAQQPGRNLALVVRAASGRPFALADFKRLEDAVDPAVEIRGGRTLLNRLKDALEPEHTASAWIAVFGAIALVLAVIGLYGMVAQSVSQRRREFAMRSALGAEPRDILATVLTDGLRVAAMGAGAGLLVGAMLFRLLRSLDAHVAIVDAPAALGALTALVLASLAAAAVPAWRAASADPVRVLRSQ